MKNISNFILEAGKAFKKEVLYTPSDWQKWKENTNKDVFVGNYEEDPDIELVYMPNRFAKTLTHIATYNKKTRTLYCDSIRLFGNYK